MKIICLGWGLLQTRSLYADGILGCALGSVVAELFTHVLRQLRTVKDSSLCLCRLPCQSWPFSVRSSPSLPKKGDDNRVVNCAFCCHDQWLSRRGAIAGLPNHVFQKKCAVLGLACRSKSRCVPVTQPTQPWDNIFLLRALHWLAQCRMCKSSEIHGTVQGPKQMKLMEQSPTICILHRGPSARILKTWMPPIVHPAT